MDDTIRGIGRRFMINREVAMRNHHRARRVVILLVTVCILGLADLYATITHVTSIGMIEVNPIGAYLIDANSIAGLVLFKLGSMGIGLGLLLHARHKIQGEISTWFILGVMVVLTLHWSQYNHAVASEYQPAYFAGSEGAMKVELAVK